MKWKSTDYGRKAYSWSHITSPDGAHHELKMDHELVWTVLYTEYEVMPRWMAGSFNT